MQFSPSVVSFEFAGFPMVGNLDGGHSIGLTDEGAAICRELLCRDVAEAEIRAVDDGLFEQLRKGGFFEQEGETPHGKPLKSAYLHVTQRCNLSCAGCYSDGCLRNQACDMPSEGMLEIVRGLATVGAQQLIISGGEPFLREDLPTIAQQAKRCGIGTVKVITNGTCVTADKAEALAPFVNCIAVSFDGWSATAPSPVRSGQKFEALTAAIATIQQAGIPAHIIATVHSQNIGQVEQYTKFAQQLGTTMNFSILSCRAGDGPLSGLVPAEEGLARLGTLMVEIAQGAPHIPDFPLNTSLSVGRNCGAGRSVVSIDADGSVYPCHMLHYPEFKMGDATSSSLQDILIRQSALVPGQMDVSRTEGCAACDYRYFCAGGCRARSYCANSTIEAKDPYCAMATSFYEAYGKLLRARVYSS